MKFIMDIYHRLQKESPSARREWIEIGREVDDPAGQWVSLREEGVD